MEELEAQLEKELEERQKRIEEENRIIAEK